MSRARGHRQRCGSAHPKDRELGKELRAIHTFYVRTAVDAPLPYKWRSPEVLRGLPTAGEHGPGHGDTVLAGRKVGGR